MNHDSSHLDGDEKAWYRHPFLWMAILLPATAVVAGLITLYIAIVNADDPVVDEWYKEGKAINRSAEQEQLAARLGIRLELSQVGAGVQARLLADTAIPMPSSIKVAMRHPTLADRDVVIELVNLEDNQYRGDGVLPQDGRRNVTVTAEGNHWRLYQTIFTDSDNLHLGAVPAS
ncbi:MAG: FixH family protein [Alcanivorax sediminis]|uniref:Nitrogen fixation protein FixH n=1 Tax=Alcanivorax sediminis TaxID=2663008 RepID=A0A6N7LU25_9GAMM|nr:FixH family protein [Alcanivorax sediminis]MQX53979.1 hypothetical protein [Alcanivorax sediminis]